MPSELKARLADWRATASALYDKGAVLQQELGLTDTYYNQPAGSVLKLTETGGGATLVELKASGGGFEAIRKQDIAPTGVEGAKKRLAAKHGVKCVLDKKRLVTQYRQYTVLFELIKGLGDFLIVQGKDLRHEVFGELGLQKPKLVTKSFDELWRENKGLNLRD
jgi:adenylate cyclase class IV